MSSRNLYIVAYDIGDEVRLNRVRKFLQGYSSGNQKSVYECFLTKSELQEVIEEVKLIIDERIDRVHIFQLDCRRKVKTLGVAVPPKDPSYFYVG